MFQSTYIGLDVLAQTVAACALNPPTGEVEHAKMAVDPDVVLSWIQRFPSDAKAVYEAGPTGYALARHLLTHGVHCMIAAPSKLLRAPGDHVKTDNRDPLGLARMLSLGEVTEVRIPTVEQEALRDLSRTSLQAPKALKPFDARIDVVAETCEYAKVINALKCLRGVDLTTAFGLAVETGDWTRFTGSTSVPTLA